MGIIYMYFMSLSCQTNIDIFSGLEITSSDMQCDGSCKFMEMFAQSTKEITLSFSHDAVFVLWKFQNLSFICRGVGNVVAYVRKVPVEVSAMYTVDSKTAPSFEINSF